MAARTARKPARKTARKSSEPRQSVFDIVTEKIIAQLEAGTAPWRRPWASAGNSGLPMRMNAGKPYRGINNILLNMAALSEGYRSPWWGTYDEIAKRSGMQRVPDSSRKGYHYESPDGSERGVRKGEKGTLVILWKRNKWTEKDADGKDEEHFGAMLRYFNVFNAEQAHAEYMPAKYLPAELPAAPGAENEVIEEAEAIVRRYLENNGPALTHDNAGRAFYRPFDDLINSPDITQFPDVHEYYSTLFHECGHSTGHDSRLARKLGAGCVFGSRDYSKEELIAEMTCAFLCAFAGVNTPEVTANSAAYLASWIKVLKGDSKLVVHAAAAAQHAVDAIMGVSWDNEETEATTEEAAELVAA